MIFLAAAVTVAGALCLLDLLLTFGVIRRLREHTEILSRAAIPETPVIGLAAGEPVPAFSVRTLGGELLTGAAGLRVAAFFSSSCPSCPERVEPFARYLAGQPVAPDTVLSVLVAAGGDLPPYTARLSEMAGRVCVVQPGSEVLTAFKVAGFPAFCLLDADGAVTAVSYDPARLPEPATAA